MKNKKLFEIVLLLFFLLSADKLTAQKWFPMELGNRWDYDISTYCHGGNWSHYTVSLIIVDTKNFGTEKDYFVFSPYGLFDHNILRIENDSLYAFIEEDSTECLLLAFNLEDSSIYSASCLYDSVYFFKASWSYFGYADSQQVHFNNSKMYEISKKFGFVSSDDWWGGLCETWYHLSGCIISDTTYGVLLDATEIKNPILNSYELYQNYPNPFNSTTNIEFHIADLPDGKAGFGFVNLKVYDVLGNEIATLVNEEKSAGTYEIEFNASSLPSGTYFYRLKAGDYIETKKMVLMR